jgi:hypothetical protein
MKNKFIQFVGVVSMLAAAGATASTVSVNPAALTVAPGDAFAVTVVADFSDVPAGFTDGTFALAWDPTILTLTAHGVATELNNAFAQFATDHPGFVKFPAETNVVEAPGSLEFLFTNCGLDFIGGGTACNSVIGDPTVDIYDLTFEVAPGAVDGTTGADLEAGFVLLGAEWRSSSADGTTSSILPTSYVDATITISAVPVPPAVWLFASGLLGLVGVARRRSQASASLAGAV